MVTGQMVLSKYAAQPPAFKPGVKPLTARRFGKSVASSGHGQLRRFLAYKSTASGRAYDEPDSTNSTRMCSTCHALTGPTGLAQLSVRQWRCSGCGTLHDRDINSAINTLYAGAGTAHEVIL
jgi:transposase